VRSSKFIPALRGSRRSTTRDRWHVSSATQTGRPDADEAAQTDDMPITDKHGDLESGEIVTARRVVDRPSMLTWVAVGLGLPEAVFAIRSTLDSLRLFASSKRLVIVGVGCWSPGPCCEVRLSRQPQLWSTLCTDRSKV